MNQKGLAPILIILLITVALGGYFVYTNYSNSGTKITQPQPTTQLKSKLQPSPSNLTHESTTSAASPVPNGTGETANWKTYRNNKFNFSFQYPSHWELRDNTTDQNSSPNATYYTIVLFSSNQKYSDYGADIDIVILDNTQNLSIEEFVSTKILAGGTKTNLTYKNVNVGGVDGKQALDFPTQIEGVQIFLKKDKYIHQIQSSVPSDKKIYRDIFNQILSTFKFIP